MNSKTRYNKYSENYEVSCPTGWHSHPAHPKARTDGCMKDTDMKESFGAFSLGAAVRSGCRCPRGCGCGVKLIGVN